jgi:phenylacetate-CoA ligase
MTSPSHTQVDWRAVQRTRLLEELRWARRSPFCADRIAPLDGVTADDAFAALAATGFSDKHSYMSAMDRGEVLVPNVPLVREYWTSGTSGKGRERIALGPIEERSFLFTHMVQMREAGLGRGSRLGLTWPGGPQAGGVVLREAAEMLGVIPVELGSLDTEDKADFIIRNGITAVVGSALYLRRLLDVGGEALADALHVFLIAGEHYPLDWAQHVDAAGIRTFEWYGSTQTGALGFSCRRGIVDADGERGILHVAPHMFAIEVLDPDGEHVADGERGELIITGLARFATPLIRYRSADDVRWLGWSECDVCGRAWPSIECGTIERVDDMVRIRGMNVWPSAVGSVLARWPEVLDYRGRLWVDERALERADLLLETAAGHAPDADLGERIQRALKEEVGVNFAVTFSGGPMPTAEFKQRRFTDERFGG